MTNEFLVDNIFPASSLSADARLALIEDAERLIKSAGAENWDLARLAAEVKDVRFLRPCDRPRSSPSRAATDDLLRIARDDALSPRRRRWA